MSPNVGYIPEVIGGYVEEYLRLDGSYGNVDPVLWPQLHVPRYAFLAAVRKQVFPPHPYAPMWSIPTAEDFIALTETPYCGLGFLRPSFVDPMVSLAKLMTKAVANYHADGRLPSDAMDPLRYYERAMRQACQRISHLPTTFHDLVLQISLLRRYWLMCAAIVDYATCMAEAPSSVGIYVHHEFMGAWTPDPSVAQRFMEAGIPVWFTRPVNLLDDRSSIDGAKSPIRSDQVCFPPMPSYPPLYCGPAGEGHLDMSLRGGHTSHDLYCPPTDLSCDDEYELEVSHRTLAKLPCNIMGKRSPRVL